MKNSFALTSFALSAFIGVVSAFSSTTNFPHHATTTPTSTNLFMSTVLPKPETETEKRQDSKGDPLLPQNPKTPGPIEYLVDDRSISRDSEDPFHILLLDETFFQNDRITIEYVASSCSYVLQMPYDEAAELAAHAKSEGFSCLGTWGHDECLRLGRQLQNRDIVCRVVPFCEGGQRGWQARNSGEGGLRRTGGGGEGSGSESKKDTWGWD